MDTVGAGDCFYAGCLSHLLGQGALDGRDAPAPDQLADALAFGNRVTAHNLQRAGCQPPWRHEL
jgi:fructokinase